MSFCRESGKALALICSWLTLSFQEHSPRSGTDVDLTNILCKSAALPASNLGVIEVPFRGRTVKIAGDRTFDTWTATFVNDEDMRIRAFMEEWMGEINSHAGNKSALFTPETSGQGYIPSTS